MFSWFHGADEGGKPVAAAYDQLQKNDNDNKPDKDRQYRQILVSLEQRGSNDLFLLGNLGRNHIVLSPIE